MSQLKETELQHDRRYTTQFSISAKKFVLNKTRNIKGSVKIFHSIFSVCTERTVHFTKLMALAKGSIIHRPKTVLANYDAANTLKIE